MPLLCGLQDSGENGDTVGKNDVWRGGRKKDPLPYSAYRTQRSFIGRGYARRVRVRPGSRGRSQRVRVIGTGEGVYRDFCDRTAGEMMRGYWCTMHVGQRQCGAFQEPYAAESGGGVGHSLSFLDRSLRVDEWHSRVSDARSGSDAASDDGGAGQAV